MKQSILMKPLEVRNWLDEQFGLTKDQLLEVVHAGVTGRMNCTANDPCSAPGYMSWKDATRRLREITLPLGWERDETDNIPSVYHRKRGVKIAVCNTDAGTGLKDYHPQPITNKGDGARRAISPNQSSFPLLEDTLNAIEAGSATFWYLCIYCEDEEVRAELSCPILNTDGSFKDFYKRGILLGPDDGGDFGIKVQKAGPDGGGDTEFDIPVKRKQAS